MNGYFSRVLQKFFRIFNQRSYFGGVPLVWRRFIMKSFFTKIFQVVERSANQRSYFDWVPKERIAQEDRQAHVFEAGSGYFQIRLVEMFLRDKRHYWNGYIPMVVTLSDFIYDNKQISVPVYIGNNLLKSIETKVKDEYVEYINTSIIGPVPYNGGDISFFLGLFRIKISDISLNLFKFMEDLISTYKIPVLSSYLEVASSIKAGFEGILDIGKEVQMQIGNRIVFTDVSGEPHQMREGYLLNINCPYIQIDQQIQSGRLWIERDRLWVREKSQTKPYEENDYCLLKIIHRHTRNDYGVLGFNDLFNKIRKEIFKNNREYAEHLFFSLIRQVAQSPDLTQEHQYELVQLYTGNYEKQIDLFLKTNSRIVTPNFRGANDDLDAKNSIKAMAYFARKHRKFKKAEKGLLTIGENIDAILGKDYGTSDLNDEVLTRQLESLAKINTKIESTPTEFVDSISFAMRRQA